MSSSSFATAAISAMRANQPQYPASATVPRHTYSSSYARDYADLQRYNEYLKTHSDAQQSARKVSKAAHEATNNQPANNYNIVNNARKPHEPVRAPYYQDDDEPVRRESSYQNPDRYVTSAQEAYIPPQTGIISARLPPRPSTQQNPPAAKAAAPAPRVNAPWATLGENGNDRRTDSREDFGRGMKRPSTASTTSRQNDNPIVPSLPLSKVSQKAYEPYDQPDAEAEPVRPRDTRSDSRDYAGEDDCSYGQRDAREEAERELTETYGAPAPRREDREREYEDRRGYNDQQGFDDSRDRGYNKPAPRRSTHQDEDEDFERARAQFRASPDERGAAEFGKRVELGARQQQQHSREPSRYDDEEDQVSQPMGNMRVDERERDSRQERRDDGDRYRKQYQDGDDYDQPRREQQREQDYCDDRRDDRRDPAPQSVSRPATASRYSSRPTYTDQAAGRSSGLSMQSQRDRVHQPLWGGEPEKERPRVKMVPSYAAYIEKSSREPKKKTGGPAYDPQAAGARVSRTISRFGTDDSERAGEYAGAQEGREAVVRRGVRLTENSAAIHASDRNPILQNSSAYDPRPGSLVQSSAVQHGGASGARGETPGKYSNETAPQRRPVADHRHPSFESASLPVSARQQKTDGSVGYDRGVRHNTQHLVHAHSNIFGNLPSQYEVAPTQEKRGVKVVDPERQGQARSHDALKSENLMYHKPIESEWRERSPEGQQQRREAAGDADYQQQQQGSYDRTPASSSPAPSHPAVGYTGTASSRIHRSPEHQQERDRYEAELRRLHAEQQGEMSARGKPRQAQQGYQSTRLW